MTNYLSILALISPLLVASCSPTQLSDSDTLPFPLACDEGWFAISDDGKNLYAVERGHQELQSPTIRGKQVFILRDFARAPVLQSAASPYFLKAARPYWPFENYIIPLTAGIAFINDQHHIRALLTTEDGVVERDIYTPNTSSGAPEEWKVGKKARGGRSLLKGNYYVFPSGWGYNRFVSLDRSSLATMHQQLPSKRDNDLFVNVGDWLTDDEGLIKTWSDYNIVEGRFLRFFLSERSHDENNHMERYDIGAAQGAIRLFRVRRSLAGNQIAPGEYVLDGQFSHGFDYAPRLGGLEDSRRKLYNGVEDIKPLKGSVFDELEFSAFGYSYQTEMVYWTGRYDVDYGQRLRSSAPWIDNYLSATRNRGGENMQVLSAAYVDGEDYLIVSYATGQDLMVELIRDGEEVLQLCHP